MKRKTLKIAFLQLLLPLALFPQGTNGILFTTNGSIATNLYSANSNDPITLLFNLNNPEYLNTSTFNDTEFKSKEPVKERPTVNNSGSTGNNSPSLDRLFVTENQVTVKLCTIMSPRGIVTVWMPVEDEPEAKKEGKLKKFFKGLGKREAYHKKCPTF